ncbi:AraC family transcriptional regulator [Azospirillum canadense]|uniref:AraC family transcriptional regulator n=1 Tax=Azospirillum canadense TaxID=403962 RepID=UPI0022262D1B|nr:AraC family transcriptional regulator [Azospirillum canadense]MCW2240614.1 AraC-like DNA-binding protein [Azospirillum canadense]
MDPLTDIIRLLRPKSALLGAMSASGRWGIRMPPQPGPTFYLVTEGRCWFKADGGEPLELKCGDYILSAKPLSDAFLSSPEVNAVVADAAFKACHTIEGELRIGDANQVPKTKVLGGLILCDRANADMLIELLPRYIHVCASRNRSAMIEALITMIRDEASASRPGHDAVLSRLLEVMLIKTLRNDMSTFAMDHGTLRALSDERLNRALSYIHANVSRDWTIAILARHAGMSRSVFARKFSQVLGMAPIEYLLRWRMALAKDSLLRNAGTLEQIAASVGYQSASAFSTAFRQKVGCSPSQYALRFAQDNSTVPQSR